MYFEKEQLASVTVYFNKCHVKYLEKAQLASVTVYFNNCHVMYLEKAHELWSDFFKAVAHMIIFEYNCS